MKIYWILITFLFFHLTAVSQMQKLDMWRGNYTTYTDGNRYFEMIEDSSLNLQYKTIRKVSVMDTTTLKSKLDSCSMLIGKLKNLCNKSRKEFVEHADFDNRCYYERTYYTIVNNKYIYHLQIILHSTTNGIIRNIEFRTTGHFTNRDRIMDLKQKTDVDEQLPPRID